MIEIIPAIIPRNADQMIEEIDLVSDFAKKIQIDISDGVFTSFKTWPFNGEDADFFEKLKNEEEGWPKWEFIDYEIHFMADNVEEFLLSWIKTGISSIVVHIESKSDLQKILDTCKEFRISVWLAIKPSTDISQLAPFVLKVEGIQCMGSDSLGRHGVELDDKAIEQIKKLREFYPDSKIGVDIGVNLENQQKLKKLGVTKFVCGSVLLDADNPKEMFEDLSQI